MATTPRRSAAVLASAFAALALVAVLAPVAGAQPGYPPPSGSTVVSNDASVTCAVGQTCTFSLAGFPPGASVTISVNGTPVAFLTADAHGFVTFTVTVTDPHISINGGKPVAVPYGKTPVRLHGGGVTKVFFVDIRKPKAAPTTTTGSGTSGGLAFTGADIAATVAGGAALLIVGSILVVATRRRSSRAESSSS